MDTEAGPSSNRVYQFSVVAEGLSWFHKQEGEAFEASSRTRAKSVHFSFANARFVLECRFLPKSLASHWVCGQECLVKVLRSSCLPFCTRWMAAALNQTKLCALGEFDFVVFLFKKRMKVQLSIKV